MNLSRIAMIIIGVTASLLFAGCNTATPTAGGSDSHEKVFHLYAGDLTQELAKGTTLYSWGYGLWDEQANKPASAPTMPGPELRVQEGDHVKVVFHNMQKEPHTIHFHGVDNSFQGDGTPGVSEEEVQEGGTSTYEFDAKKSGTYWYHCHVEPDRHPEMGLYGAFIVEPKKKTVKVDGETVWMLGERDPKLALAEGTEAEHFVGTAAEHEHLENGEYDTVDRKAKFFTVNGKMDSEIPSIVVKQGGKYLVRLINAGAEVHSIHLHGHHFQVIATDGRDIPFPETKDTVTLGPGERYDILITADNPGAWPIHCHMGPHGAHGMHAFLVYEGYEDKVKDHHEMHLFSSILSELAEMKEYHFNKKYDMIKVEGHELASNFDKVKDALNTKDANLVKEIEATLADLDKNATDKADGQLLGNLINKLEEQLNKAHDLSMEE